jgi:uncharacterized LabA/DUF88 family protein
VGFGRHGSLGRREVATPLVQYLFIDGGCLRTTMTEIEKNFAGGAKLHLDFAEFTREFAKVFYYDALPSRAERETEEEFSERISDGVSFLDHLGSLDRFHVYEGETRRSSSRKKQEQKQVDIMIAVDMLTHSFRRNMQRATLLTADLDFKPLLEALVNEGMFVTLWYPPNRTNSDLIKSADQRRKLDVRSIYGALLPSSKEYFSIPQIWAQEGKPAGFDSPIKRWVSKNGHYELHQIGNEYVIVGPNDEVPRYLMFFRHSDLDLLRVFSRTVLLAPIPD